MTSVAPQNVPPRSAKPWIRWNSPAGRLAKALLITLSSAVLAFGVSPLHVQSGVDPSVINTVATEDVVASEDFFVDRSDPEDIEQVREEARSTVAPVWDYRPEIGDALNRRIRDTFRRQRLELERAGLRSVTLPSDEDHDPATVLHAALTNAESLVAFDAALQDSTQSLSYEERLSVVVDSGGLQSLVLPSQSKPSQRALELLTNDAFSLQSEETLLTLVNYVMSRYIVESRNSIDSLDRDGIFLRTTTEESPGLRGRRVRYLNDFHSVDNVDDLLYAALTRIPSGQDEELVDGLIDLSRSLILANTEPNQAETTALEQEAAALAEESYRAGRLEQYHSGEILIEAGQIISLRDYELLSEHDAQSPQTGSWYVKPLLHAVFLLTALLILTGFAERSFRRYRRSPRDYAMMLTVLVFQLAIFRVTRFVGGAMAESMQVIGLKTWLIAGAPFAGGAVVIRLLTSSQNAWVYSLGFSILVGLLSGGDASASFYALLTSLAGAAIVSRAHSRTELMRAVAPIGALAALLASLRGIQQGLAPDELAIAGLLASVSGLSSIIFAFALIPVMESLFRYTTSLRLMELANMNHPALRELIMKAPGSYHHSLMVGQLVEAACESVGADALLGRVGAYFHDIGKTKNPQYFAENQRPGHNPHDKLKPNMSALMIKSHVKDGLEMARRFKLPPEIQDFIVEHHGTSLIKYFYVKAQKEHGDSVNESDYRYPGPKPQSRETAICMLADGIEAASRSLPNPSPDHLRQLIHNIINKAFTDGQLDECDLTLRDLHAIASAFHVRLTAFYHHRPEYPEQKASASARPTPSPQPPKSPPPTSSPSDNTAAKSASGEPPKENADDRGTSESGDEPAPPGDTAVVTEESGVHLRRLGM